MSSNDVIKVFVKKIVREVSDGLSDVEKWLSNKGKEGAEQDAQGSGFSSADGDSYAISLRRALRRIDSESLSILELSGISFCIRDSTLQEMKKIYDKEMDEETRNKIRMIAGNSYTHPESRKP
ncbi:hypothetical protein HHS34_005325 [Acidithiobacillus montserratensis]|uniref:Uncharacterized protein n=1 Tax=Acidithiobacillus montserratensis TaxID=2729135 RepID=A0ACD5HJR7_9PROT|nr:hypothetical protein [Acidithiobacillus montserratensis]MBU2746587.1 hypothetical protein [Acidithiobacillus montserratensis]